MAIFAAVNIVLLLQIYGHEHTTEIVTKFIIRQLYHILLYVLEQFSKILVCYWTNFTQFRYFDATGLASYVGVVVCGDIL